MIIKGMEKLDNQTFIRSNKLKISK